MRVTIKSDIKKHLVQYGFIRRANDYYRIVNDMVQGIHIKEKHVMGVVALDIRFEMFPLCHDISWRDGKEKLDAFSLFDGYSIWQLYPPRDHLIMFEFNYTPGDYGSVLQCLANMINAIDTYLIPFFDRYDSCEALYADENNVYCRLTNLYDLALKTGDIQKAIEFLQSQIVIANNQIAEKSKDKETISNEDQEIINTTIDPYIKLKVEPYLIIRIVHVLSII